MLGLSLTAEVEKLEKDKQDALAEVARLTPLLVAAENKAADANSKALGAAERAEVAAQKQAKRIEELTGSLAQEKQSHARTAEELVEARDTIAKHLHTIERADAATDRAEKAFTAEQSAHSKTRENAASDVQGLKATHADILKTERTQVFNLNELVAKLNREATETKAAHEKALASLREDMELLKLSHADAMLAAQERRLADVTAARAASDAEIAAARGMMDDIRAIPAYTTRTKGA